MKCIPINAAAQNICFNISIFRKLRSMMTNDNMIKDVAVCVKTEINVVKMVKDVKAAVKNSAEAMIFQRQ